VQYNIGPEYPFSGIYGQSIKCSSKSGFQPMAQTIRQYNASDIGWLLYSTCAQDEERLTQSLSHLIGENIGVKWKPIRTMAGGSKR
jgi:hypothetical protein